MVIPHASILIILEPSSFSPKKYEKNPNAMIIKVSEMGEWVIGLNDLKTAELINPMITPIPTDLMANTIKSYAIPTTLYQANVSSPPFAYSSSVLTGNYDYTTPKRIILTISLNTPSPYTIENNFGDSL
jgi:hypothetical protein